MVKLSDVYSALSSDEYMICAKDVGMGVLKDREYVVVYDRTANEEHGMHQMKRVYHILPDNELEEVPIDTMIATVKEAIRDKLPIDDLLEQMLRTGGPHSLIRVYEILKKHPEVKRTSLPEKDVFSSKFRTRNQDAKTNNYT